MFLRKKSIFELFNTDGIQSNNPAVNALTETEKEKECDVTIQIDGDIFEFSLAYGGQNMLDAAIACGADLPYACKEGMRYFVKQNYRRRMSSWTSTMPWSLMNSMLVMFYYVRPIPGHLKCMLILIRNNLAMKTEIANKKQFIISAAAELFKDKRYKATSIRDLAAKWAWNHPVYTAISDQKEDLLSDICMTCADRLLQPV
ncbi:MAG: hypothetical protein IPL08_21845 [Saprospiraceae bacterium]|nr:hypothetical protein [Saprospiraceae bacterium]